MKTNAVKSNKTEQNHGARVTQAIVASNRAQINPKLNWAVSRQKILDDRLGLGIGATRERKRIAAIISSK
jgi:hypothetical protein